MLFVDKLSSKVRIQVGGRRASGFVCIADGSSTNNTTFTVDGAAERASYPGLKTRPFTCAKLAVPERVPVNTESTNTTAASVGTAIAELGMTTYAVTGVVSLLLLALSAF